MIEVWITSPPHRDSVVAELQIHHESTVDQPVEIFRVDGKLMIALYVSPERHPIELPLGEFLEAVGKSIDELGAQPLGELAARAGERFNIIVGPRFAGSVSSPTVQQAVSRTGGATYQIDPATGFMSQVFPKMTSLSVLELTWYIHPLRIPVDPDVVLDTIGKTFPPAMPMRFGLGDPPAFKWGPDGADRFRAEWRDKMEAGYFTQWTGK